MADSDEAVLAAFPRVPITRDDLEIYRGRLQRRLLVMRCDACGRWHAPARSICPTCWSDAVAPREVSGTGTVALLTVVHVGPADAGVDYSGGHPVVAVELDEQPDVRVTGSLVSNAPGELAIGAPVRLTWIERGGVPAPAFEPAAP